MYLQNLYKEIKSKTTQGLNPRPKDFVYLYLNSGSLAKFVQKEIINERS